MKNKKISNNVIRRLPRYMDFLSDLNKQDIDRISSGAMAEKMGLTASQIRQDFSCFGGFGQQGYGYNVQMLYDEIAKILGITEKKTAILVGAGRLGHTLLDNFPFTEYGIEVEAAFDVAKGLIGTSISKIPVYHMDDLENNIKLCHPKIAILTVPKNEARPTANKLIDLGIRGIWNFTNVELKTDNEKVIIESIHFSDSLLSLNYYLSNNN